jgi:hypothetical protein
VLVSDAAQALALALAPAAAWVQVLVSALGAAWALASAREPV